MLREGLGATGHEVRAKDAGLAVRFRSGRVPRLGVAVHAGVAARVGVGVVGLAARVAGIAGVGAGRMEGAVVRAGTAWGGVAVLA